ncbi:MAG: N-acetylmuramoyl-L-alanine amidase [Thermaerobacter sp.]|nr:N-acetylmuramoyl-L-alanine amidase [Thermaerobacter sp.]
MKPLIAALAAGALLMSAPQTQRKPLAGHVIVVDPGHGGRDSGARAGGLFESDIVLAIGKVVAAALREEGAKVVMTREDQNNLKATAHGGNLQRQNLAARVALADRVKADLFLSVHTNKYPEYPAAHGAQVFLGESPTPDQQRLAESLMRELGPLTNSQRMIDGRRPLYLMRHLKVTAVLIEFGFISNDRERQLLTQPSYQRQLAQAVARGVVAYYKIPAVTEQMPPSPVKNAHRRTLEPLPHRIAARRPAHENHIYPSARA